MSEQVQRRIRLAATMASVQEFQSFAKEAVAAFGLSGEVSSRVELVLEELLVNIVSYAYPPGSDAWVEMDCWSDRPGVLGIRIQDSGRAFNPLARPDPCTDRAVSQREVGGLGLMLVRKMADRISYRREGDANLLTLEFRSREQELRD